MSETRSRPEADTDAASAMAIPEDSATTSGLGLGLGGWRLLAVVALATLTLGVGLGHSARLTYHEAFVAQSAREMLATGNALIPTLGGRPWLEKPPLAIWLVALAGRVTGGVGEAEARLPSAVAALFLALGVSVLAARRFGPNVGLLAGLVQATTSWTVFRGRLAEADMLLACLVVWTLVAFDRLREKNRHRARIRDEGRFAPNEPNLADREARSGGSSSDAKPLGFQDLASPTLVADDPLHRAPNEPNPADRERRLQAWRWAFFAGLGLTSLAKGIGFGAVLILLVVAVCLVWDRDRATLRRLRFPRGWVLTSVLALAWPVLAGLRHPSALGLWVMHVSDRLAENPEHFAGRQPWWHYGPPILGQLLPWTPLAFLGAFRSLPRVFRRSGRWGGDRLLWVWAIAPIALLSLATIKSAHYAIHALPPWSIWSALGLVRVGERLREVRGWSSPGVRRGAWGVFAGLGVAYGIGFAGIGPWFREHGGGRGVEWAFYESAGKALAPGEPVTLLYNVPEWDREPYPTPFGPVPHDWGVRLFYLNRPAPCAFGVEELAKSAAKASPASGFAVIGRESDLPALNKLGRVELLAQGPTVRASASKVDDRTYRLYRVVPPSVIAEGSRARR